MKKLSKMNCNGFQCKKMYRQNLKFTLIFVFFLEYPDIEPNTNGINEEVAENTIIKRKFKWPEFALSILQSREDKQLSLKKLKKKLIAEYACINGEIGDVEALWAKGLKKISKASQFKINKDNITLL